MDISAQSLCIDFSILLESNSLVPLLKRRGLGRDRWRFVSEIGYRVIAVYFAKPPCEILILPHLPVLKQYYLSISIFILPALNLYIYILLKNDRLYRLLFRSPPLLFIRWQHLFESVMEGTTYPEIRGVQHVLPANRLAFVE